MVYLGIQDAAQFSRVNRTALQVFRCPVHWRGRLNRLGRGNVISVNLYLSFRMAITQVSLFLWTDLAEKRTLLLESILERPVLPPGFFPVLKLGPLGCRTRHDYIVTLIRFLSTLTPVSLSNPTWVKVQSPSVEQLIQAFLVISHRLGIQLFEVGGLSCNYTNNVGIKIDAWKLITVHTPLDIMTSTRLVCQGTANSAKWCRETTATPRHPF